MYNEVQLKERFIIIKNANLADATILDQNYRQFIRDTPNPDEQRQLVILVTNVQRRIQRLKETA